MTSPPGSARTSANGITGTRTNAETNRVLTGTFKRLARCAGFELAPWQVRTLIASTLANHDAPSDEDLMLALMRAPWFPKPGRRHWRLGEGGGWAVRS